MARLLEITPRRRLLWEMPDSFVPAIQRGLQLRLARSVSGVISCFPEKLRGEIRATSLPVPPAEVRGLAGHVFVDDLPASALPPHALPPTC